MSSDRLQSVMERVLELQDTYSSTNTPEMEERGQLVRRTAPEVIRDWLSGSRWEAEGRDGTGRKTRVPWFRVYDPDSSPSATAGWYVVYLFSHNGDAVYVSLNQGTNDFRDGDLHAKPRDQLTENVEQARKILSEQLGLDADLQAPMDLHDPRGLGEGYELGNVAARRYQRGMVPSDAEIEADLKRFLGMLEVVAGLESGGVAEPRFWLFQGNPKVWPEMHSYFGGLTGEGEWSVRQRGEDMAAGDRVAFWSSGASGGVVALGELTSGTYERPTPEWYQSDAPTETAVRFRMIKPLQPLIARWECKEDQVLADLPVLHFPQGTNYLLTKEMWERILTMAEPMHVLLKWSDHPTPEAVQQHRDVAIDKGTVIWGNLGAELNDQRADQLQSQLDAGVDTFAYLWGPPSVPTLWRAHMVAVTNDKSSVDTDLIPDYYRNDLDGIGTCFTFNGFEELDRGSADGLIELRSNPQIRITDSVQGQSSVMFVNERTTPLHEDINGSERSSSSGRAAFDELVTRTLLEPDVLEEMVQSLSGSQPQIVLTGPPGTGKTWVAQALARHVLGFPQDSQEEVGSDRIRLVQFHPSYGYEEFVEGLRPTPVEGGGLQFQVELGVIRDMAKQINEDGLERVLIIDEMNRANLPRVFGELMFLLEYRDETMQLMNGEPFSLPEGLRIVATMNTADRSVRSIDIALRRRFDFFELPANPEVLKRFYGQPGKSTSVARLDDGFVNLNAKLREHLDRHQEVGHTFFFPPRGSGGTFDAAQLRRVWKLKVFPLIEEYFFDQPDRLEDYEVESFWPYG